MESGSFVTINIGGRRFVTSKQTLMNVPGTKLASLSKTDSSYVASRDEYFFDRNPDFFGPILDFYRHGELHFSHCFCGKSVRKELEFWGIDEYCIAGCCWRAYKEHENEKKTIETLEKNLYNSGNDKIQDITQEEQTNKPRERCCSKNQRWGWRNVFWRFLEYPQSSKSAQAWAIAIFVLIMLSIAVAVMESHPDFRVPLDSEEVANISKDMTNPKKRMYFETRVHPTLEYIDGVCLAIFSLELTFRFFVCPSKLRFFKSAYNLIDVFSILPLLAYFIITTAYPAIIWQGGGHRKLTAVIYLSISSVLRVFRLFKLAKHYRALKILQLAVRSSFKELSLLLLLITTGTLLFSTVMYYAEFHLENSHFMNIPIGFWWSTITMTTVGYGDIVPCGAWGYLVGGICAISGMLITGLPIPIIASNFNHYYTYARLTNDMVEKRKCEKQIWRGVSQCAVNNGTSSSSLTTSSRSGQTVKRIVVTSPGTHSLGTPNKPTRSSNLSTLTVLTRSKSVGTSSIPTRSRRSDRSVSIGNSFKTSGSNVANRQDCSINLVEVK